VQFTNASNRAPYAADLNNFQPRLGVAYQVTPNTVIRGGFGVIYFNTLERPYAPGFDQTTSYNNYITNTPINPLSNPFPAGVVLPTGSSLGLSTLLGQNIDFIDPNHIQPKSTQFTFNIQQQLPGDVAVQVAYIGARPTHLEVDHNINVLPPQYYNQGGAEVNFLNKKVANPMAGLIPQSTTLNNALIQQYLLLVPYPEFGTVTEHFSPIGSAPYNALQIQVSKPMKHHFSIQGNLTWDKIMLHNGFFNTNSNSADQYSAAVGKLYSVQDGTPNIFGNIFGTYQFPKFLAAPVYERVILGGWSLNSVARFTNGNLVNAPGNVDIVGDYHQPGASLQREFNTCYQSYSLDGTTGAVTYNNVSTAMDSTKTYNTSTACDAQSSTPAFRQRIPYTSQTNSTVLNLRIPLHPLVDASLFKQFTVREGVSFEIRGEFFNILNTPEWGAPSNTNGVTNLGAANAGSAAGAGSLATPNGIKNQANDARIGQLTARINF
jgi:hypothetical protein